MVDMRNGVRVYHYKHGWIPLDHFAAMQKAKGNRKLAERYLEKAHAAGHAHGSFASTGTHKAGGGGGSHLRRTDGFQPVANEHLRRDKHVIAAFHPETRQFHLLDTQRGHTAVISEEQARDIHLQGHKIIGISKSESGGTQIKVQNMANGQVHRIDAQRDHLHGVGAGEYRPGSARKPADATVAVHAGIVDGRAERDAARARADAKRAAMKPPAPPKAPSGYKGPNAQQAEGIVGDHKVTPAGEALVNDHLNRINAAKNRDELGAVLARLVSDMDHGKLKVDQVRAIREAGLAKMQALREGGPAGDLRAKRKLAYELQGKGRRLRNVDRLMEHRENVLNADVGTRNRAVLLRQVDAKIAKAGGAVKDREAAAEAMKGGEVDSHFQNGGNVINAPQRGLFDYLKAHPERFTVKSSSKNGQVSETFKITDQKTGEIAWRKDDGYARYGAAKEKLAADIGNDLGFFSHRANMDIGRHDGKANHVIIEHAPGVQGFGENNRHNEAGVGEAIRKGSDPASLMRMMMFDYLVANDEDRHLMNFHVVDEGGGKMRAAILDHGRAFGGASSDFEHAPVGANFSQWFQKYKRHSARGWDANAVARAAYPNDSDASRAYDQIVQGMKGVDVGQVIQKAFNSPGMDQLPQAKREQWAQLIRTRYAHLTDQKNKVGIIRAIKGI